MWVEQQWNRTPRELERWGCSPKEEAFKAMPDLNLAIVLPQLGHWTGDLQRDLSPLP